MDPGRSLAQYRLVRWDEEQGLAQTFDRIVQTQDGFIWLRGTQGLIRFDGKNFASSDDLHANIKLPSEVYGLVAGRNGELWFGSRDSLYCRLASGQFKRFDSKDGLPDGESIALLVDSEGTLWIWAPERGLVEFKEGHFSTCPGTLEMAEQEIYSISETPKGYWVATTLGVYRIDKGSGKITKFTQQDGLPADQVYAVTTDRRGRVWVATENGLARFDANGRFQPVSAEIGTVEIQSVGGRIEPISLTANGQTPVSTSVYSVYEDPQGVLWFGLGDTTLVRSENGRQQQVATLNRLPHTGPCWATGMQTDGNGDLWVGTGGAGLLRFRDSQLLKAYGPDDGLQDPVVYSLAIDHDQRLWISEREGFDLLQGAALRPARGRDATLPPKGAFCLYADSDGTVWAGTRMAYFVSGASDGRLLLFGRIPVRSTPNSTACWKMATAISGRAVPVAFSSSRKAT